MKAIIHNSWKIAQLLVQSIMFSGPEWTSFSLRFSFDISPVRSGKIDDEFQSIFQQFSVTNRQKYYGKPHDLP